MTDINISSKDFLDKLQNDEHFSFVRYNDGELISAMEYDFIFNTHIKNDTDHIPNCDKHQYFKEMNKGLQEALTNEENIMYCEQHKYIFQIQIDSMIYIIENKHEQFTGNNITLKEYALTRLKELKDIIRVKRNKCEGHGELINYDIYTNTKNVVKFIDILNTKNIILIGPEYLTKFQLLNVKKYIFIPMHNCFLEKDRIMEEIQNTMNEFENIGQSCVFLFSASMATNYIIDKIFKRSLDKHTMIDVGSLWDNFMSTEVTQVARRIYNPEFIKANYPANYWHDK